MHRPYRHAASRLWTLISRRRAVSRSHQRPRFAFGARTPVEQPAGRTAICTITPVRPAVPLGGASRLSRGRTSVPSSGLEVAPAAAVRVRRANAGRTTGRAHSHLHRHTGTLRPCRSHASSVPSMRP